MNNVLLWIFVFIIFKIIIGRWWQTKETFEVMPIGSGSNLPVDLSSPGYGPRSRSASVAELEKGIRNDYVQDYLVPVKYNPPKEHRLPFNFYVNTDDNPGPIEYIADPALESVPNVGQQVAAAIGPQIARALFELQQPARVPMPARQSYIAEEPEEEPSEEED